MVDDVIALSVGACWHHLLKNHIVAEEGYDPEGVHQMRVALRRLRTICALFRRDIPSPSFQAISSEAKWLMQQLGPARDWDVFTETTVTCLITAAPEVDLGGLREAIERQRNTSYTAFADRSRRSALQPFSGLAGATGGTPQLAQRDRQRRSGRAVAAYTDDRR